MGAGHYLMDQKVKDFERARYWKERGYDFNPNFTSAYMMDIEVSRRLESR